MISVALPHDVWMCIAQFIPQKDMRNLYAVNSSFFYIAMKLRYETLSIEELNETSVKGLVRLRDPMYSSHIKTLIFRPHHRSSVNQGSDDKKNKILQSFLGAYHVYTPFWSAKEASSKKNRQSTLFVLNNAVETVIQCIPSLTNITEFRIDAWNIPTTFDLQPLLSTAWSTFGKNLKVLSLGGYMQSFEIFAASAPSLDALEELTLEFTNNLYRIDKPGDIAYLNSFAPFVNRLNLRSLTIYSWAMHDLSDFFARLGPFPKLEKFCIRAAFNRAFRSDPSGLSRLLMDTQSLKHVELKLRPVGSALDQHTEDTLAQWLSENATTPGSTMLSGLQALHIYPTPLPLGTDAMKEYLERSALTLRQLSIRDRYLWHAELADILPALGDAPMLTSLHLNVHVLSGELLDLLSSRLPCLEQLKLSVGTIRSESAEHDDQFNVNRFRFHMQGRRYTKWPVRNIDLWQGGTRLDLRIMDLLAECIPSVQSYWSLGYKSPPQRLVDVE